ncbi:hypothetical protein [Micromonospora yangpuensis]|uniref:Uncharacterized protein n=1 Tax=Micromonospora yangpuensis TaxID=683228 RepID=A0A1C6U4G1_9ACTN|nr:hypothetical protein [Micromonospora yangpuensis]GGL92978.1 hypothetical protein GCM10012279_08350 [Micromonospora yangpuensis]SCL48801.1 hypothetical protein GA0070617_0983 [Micromonospora yangpuensis]
MTHQRKAPRTPLPTHSGATTRQYTSHAPDDAPPCADLSDRDRAPVMDPGHPHGDDRNLSHLHPDRVRPGGSGVFAGDWAWTPGPDGRMRIPTGYVGVLVDDWNGWAVFTCTPEVARAIVDDHDRARDDHHRQLTAEGVGAAQRERRVDEALARLWFDGDVLVADHRAVSDDPDAIARHRPDPAGRYTPMGRSWTWIAVDPDDCDRIVGDIPHPPATCTTEDTRV